MVSLMVFTGIGNAFVPLMQVSDSIDEANLFAKIFSMFLMMTLTTILFTVLVFPYDFTIAGSQSKKRVFITIYLVILAGMGIAAFLLTGARDYPVNTYWISNSTNIYLWTLAAIILPITAVVDFIFYRMAEEHKSNAKIMGIAIISFLSFALISIILGNGPENWVWMDLAFVTGTSIMGYLFFTNRVQILKPTPEARSIGSKSMYRLLGGRIYIVEEERPRFAFELFTEILRSRCYDCINDDSFVCESLNCHNCSLPCPCRECIQHKSRTQGLIVTRRHPGAIRVDYLIQTTPIIWVSSIPGKDNLDPSKLSLLTDIIVNFIEKSQNGVVLVEGIEYLVTANDFLRVLRAVDRWSEVVMSNSSRLILSMDPRAFDSKELTLMEKNREVVKLNDKTSIEKIMASSST